MRMESSSDGMIKRLLSFGRKKSDRWVVGEVSVTDKLISILEEMLDSIDNEEPINVDSVVRKIKLEIIPDEELEADTGLQETIVSMIESVNIDKDVNDMLEDIKSLKDSISKYFSRESLKSVFKEANLTLTRNKGANPYKVADKVLEELNEMAIGSNDDDDLMFEFSTADIKNPEKMKELNNAVKDKHVFTTGWTAYNLMTQGGVRTNEAGINAARTHNYKTGFILSVWASILLYNKPKPTDKIPTAVWYSFEDEIPDIFLFLYRLIKVTETGVPQPKATDMSTMEMAEYVIEKLSANGWNVIILKYDPSDHTYRKIINKIKKFRVSGLDVQVCVTDYIDKISTEGVKTTGPTGSDKKEVCRRLRNYFSSIDCWWDTPWQLNPSVSDLLKSGVEDKDLLNHVYNKGYYQGVTTLGNEFDLETFTHIVPTPRNGDWLHVRKGKHKIPSVIDKKYNSFYLPFPPDGPIPFDLKMEEPISRYSINDDNIFYTTSLV